jgi:predicted ATPase
MRIKKIVLDHFKRFTNLTIDLGENPAKIIALVGPNGCGKSCVFDAFEEKNKEVRGGTLSEDYLSKYKFILSPDKLNPLYERNNAIKITTADNKEFNKRSFYFRSSYRFTSKILLHQISKVSDLASDEGRPDSSIELDSRLFKNYERLIGTFFNDVYGKDKSGKEWENEKINLINNILGKILDIKISSLGNPVEGKGNLYFEKGNAKNFPFDNLSSGEKGVIDIVLDIMLKIKYFSDTIYFIDEPELHINTAIQKQLLIEIEKLIPNNCQLWIATHSIGFLRAIQQELKDKSIIIDFSEQNFDTEVVLKPLKATRKNWHRIFHTALDDLTGLIAPEIIIYCEGKKEPNNYGGELGIDASIYNEIFAEEYPNALFISSGGSTEPDKHSSLGLKILNKAFKDVKIRLLKDKDIKSDKTETTEEDRNNWIKKDTSTNRMLKRKEIENYLFDFEIIKKAYPDIDETQYKNIITDIKNPNVKDKAGDLMLLCKINTGMNKDNFKLNLAKFITKDTNIYKELKEIINF